MATRPMTSGQPSGGPDPVVKEPWEGHVSVGGPKDREQGAELHGGVGWSAGDIDFKKDGSIFIRNPYLADAIENHLQKNKQLGRTILRIVRDEGWSGNETNIVC
jgi:hypothetical protein